MFFAGRGIIGKKHLTGNGVLLSVSVRAERKPDLPRWQVSCMSYCKNNHRNEKSSWLHKASF